MPGKSGQFALTETDSDGYPLIGNTNRALRECDQKKGDSLVFEHFHAALSPTEAGLPTKKQGRLQRMEFCLRTRVGEYSARPARTFSMSAISVLRRRRSTALPEALLRKRGDFVEIHARSGTSVTVPNTALLLLYFPTMCFMSFSFSKQILSIRSVSAWSSWINLTVHGLV